MVKCGALNCEQTGGILDIQGPNMKTKIRIGSLYGLVTLVMTAIVCIRMGCGVRTTANYIIIVAVAAPVLGMMNVEPLVAHFFVFYFGVLADVTPPVALAAHAGAGSRGPTASGRATPPFGCRWARRWCPSSSSSRRRC